MGNKGGARLQPAVLLNPGKFNIQLESVKSCESIVLNNIYFHPNTYVFRNVSDDELKHLYNFMKTNDHAIIEIQGYTNCDYYIRREKRFAHLGDEWNFQGSAKKLSKHRAEAVKKILVDKGIDDSRIVVKGFGGDKMIIPHPVNYKESLKNMRVEILILYI